MKKPCTLKLWDLFDSSSKRPSEIMKEVAIFLANPEKDVCYSFMGKEIFIRGLLLGNPGKSPEFVLLKSPIKTFCRGRYCLPKEMKYTEVFAGSHEKVRRKLNYVNSIGSKIVVQLENGETYLIDANGMSRPLLVAMKQQIPK